MPNPTEYYVIVGKAKSASNEVLVITAADNNASVFVAPQEYGDDSQLWEKRYVRSGDSSAYALVNKATGKCIGRKDGTNGSKLYMENVAQADINDFMVWRDDRVAGTHNAINSLADWEQKMTMPDNGPIRKGAGLITWEWSRAKAHELWVFVPDRREIKVKHIHFELDGVDPSADQPIVTDKQIVKNHTDTDQSQVLTLSYTKGLSYSFTKERGLKISESIEFTAGLPLFGDTKVKIGVEGTRKYSQTDSQDESQELTLEVPVTVPPGQTIEVSAIVLQGKIDVPYTITFEISYPGQDQKILKTASGTYSSVNAYTVFTDFKSL